MKNTYRAIAACRVSARSRAALPAQDGTVVQTRSRRRTHETRCSRRARITRCRSLPRARRGWSGRHFCESRSWPARDCCRCRRSGRSMRRSSANWSATVTRSRRSCSKRFQASISAATCIVRSDSRGRFPASCHRTAIGQYGRLENTALVSVPGRAISLARQGYVVFTYDMVGQNDTNQIPHHWSEARHDLWNIGPMGIQLWNSIRATDFVSSLPDVDPATDRGHRRIGRRHPDLLSDGGGRSHQGRRSGEHDLGDRRRAASARTPRTCAPVGPISATWWSAR